MKHIFTILFILLSMSVAFGYRSSVIERPDSPPIDSYKLFENYLIVRADSFYPQYAIYHPFRLKSDTTVWTIDMDTDSGKIIGEWRLNDDTLFIYQLYLYWADSMWARPYDNLPDSTYRTIYKDCNMMDSAIDFRNFLSGLGQRGISDHSYGINVAVFKLKGRGDSIYGIDDSFHLVGFNVSKKMADNCNLSPYINIIDHIGALVSTKKS